MRGFKTEGIILKRKDFGEADRILTVFTIHKGKLLVLAKGVRRITSRRAGNVELLNRVQIYLHPGKNFYILTEASSVDTYPALKEDLVLSTYAYHILELIDKLTAENQENRILYENLIAVLEKLCKNPRQILVRAFEVRILENLGFWSLDEIKDINNRVKELLEILQSQTWRGIENLQVEEREGLDLERILRYSIEKVIEGKLKSKQFLRNLK